MDDSIQIIDTGSGSTKCGHENNILPAIKFPTIVGRPKRPEILKGLVRPHFVAHEAVKKRGILKLKWCVEHSIVTNWNDYEKIIRHALDSLSLRSLRRMDEKEKPSIIMPQPPLLPQANLEKLTSMLFTTFQCKSVLLESSPVASLYAYGKSSGIAIESGDGVTHISAVYEGTLMPRTVFRLNLAGRDVSGQLIRYCAETGVEMQTSRARIIAKRIKEEHCRIALDPPYNSASETSDSAEIIPITSEERKELELPDGQHLKLGSALWRAPECLYTPKYIGSSMPGLADSVWGTMSRVPSDMRALLGLNVVLSGGNTLLGGFRARTERDVANMIYGGLEMKLWDRPEKRELQHHASYVGCRILSQLGSSCEKFASREEYEEMGAKSLVRRNFFNGIGGDLKFLWAGRGQEKDVVERMEMLGEKKVRDEVLKLRFVKIGMRERDSIVVVKLLLVFL